MTTWGFPLQLPLHALQSIICSWVELDWDGFSPVICSRSRIDLRADRRTTLRLRKPHLLRLLLKLPAAILPPSLLGGVVPLDAVATAILITPSSIHPPTPPTPAVAPPPHLVFGVLEPLPAALLLLLVLAPARLADRLELPLSPIASVPIPI